MGTSLLGLQAMPVRFEGFGMIYRLEALWVQAQQTVPAILPTRVMNDGLLEHALNKLAEGREIEMQPSLVKTDLG